MSLLTIWRSGFFEYFPIPSHRIRYIASSYCSLNIVIGLHEVEHMCK